jgi:catechol 2,3-dioxygenase-like lactoylglutathione lyase family enzyme
MELGAFSVSLAVKDIAKSKAFYETLGFQAIGGDIEQNWLMMRNRDNVLGLFQGMFESNILTFNPGWDQHCNNLDSFTDVRAIQQRLKDQGVELGSEADDSSTGPASLMLSDPDGNQIMIDQHR